MVTQKRWRGSRTRVLDCRPAYFENCVNAKNISPKTPTNNATAILICAGVRPDARIVGGRTAATEGGAGAPPEYASAATSVTAGTSVFTCFMSNNSLGNMSVFCNFTEYGMYPNV